MQSALQPSIPVSPATRSPNVIPSASIPNEIKPFSWSLWRIVQDVEPASKLGLDLDVPEEEDVVEDERESTEVGALAECSHLVREDGRASGRPNEAAERPDVSGQALGPAGGECELGEAATTKRSTSPANALRMRAPTSSRSSSTGGM
jgi:hypothetical protein